MGSKTYGQNCGLARALDVLGERWTLLLIRELGLGPRRYRDLAEGLPGIGTNLLADRLKALEGAGVIEKILLPAPESVPAYTLTDIGNELVPLVGQLARWGLRHGAGFDDSDASRPRWVFQSILPGSDNTAIAKLGGAIQLTIDGESAWIGNTPDGLRLSTGVAPTEPVLALRMDIPTLVALVSLQTSTADAVDAGGLVVTGRVEDAEAFFQACAIVAAA
jgi:DNA-binding HxlR family transcriptional regulator